MEDTLEFLKLTQSIFNLIRYVLYRREDCVQNYPEIMYKLYLAYYDFEKGSKVWVDQELMPQKEMSLFVATMRKMIKESLELLSLRLQLDTVIFLNT